MDDKGEVSPDVYTAFAKGRNVTVFNDQEKLTPEQLKEEFGYTITEKTWVSSSIAQVPSEGYVRRDQYSMVSFQWLEWVMKEKNIHIQHALNGGEVKVAGIRYRLDGYCATTHTAYEFHGCLYHGCPTCYPTGRSDFVHPRTKQSMEELYALTLRKKTALRSLGYAYKCIWEHEFADLVDANAITAQFVHALDLQERLVPREAFFGGRTNAVRLHYKIQEGEKVNTLISRLSTPASISTPWDTRTSS
jgi:hypothetical protein